MTKREKLVKIVLNKRWYKIFKYYKKFMKKIFRTSCSFCLDVKSNCNLCLIDKTICDSHGNSGEFSVFFNHIEGLGISILKIIKDLEGMMDDRTDQR